MNKTITIMVAGALVVGVLATAGCQRVRLADAPKTEATHETRVVPLGAATTLDANLAIGVGELSVRSADSSANALDATFAYAPVSWKPIVDYAIESSATGVLRVEQPSEKTPAMPSRPENRWNVRLPSGVPVTLHLTLGVGESTVNLRGIDVRDLDAETGVGKATIDLSGARTQSIRAHLKSGVGELVVRLPKDVGVRVTGAKDGIGDVSASDLTTDGDALVNAAYSAGGPTIDLTIERGVGDVRFVLVP